MMQAGQIVYSAGYGVRLTMASLGCHLYKETGEGKERARNNPLFKLLIFMPNPETTAYEFWH